MGKVRTWKREVATTQLAIWWILVFRTYANIEPGNELVYEAMTDLTMALALYVWPFAVAAFGADATYKQIIPAIMQRGTPDAED